MKSFLNNFKYFYSKENMNLLFISNKQMYSIMERFHSKYISRRNKGKPNPNTLPSSQDDIKFIQAYINPCIYSNNENKKRENLIIKFKYEKISQDIISLNILLEDYKDLIK